MKSNCIMNKNLENQNYDCVPKKKKKVLNSVRENLKMGKIQSVHSSHVFVYELQFFLA